MAHPDSPTDASVEYDLEPIDPLTDAIDDFVGPQLSFEFTIPGFLEDRFASYITSVGIPWEQERYTDPLADVTDPGHRQRVGGSAPDGLRNRVVGRVRQLRSGADGALDGLSQQAREALGSRVSVSRSPLPVEVATQLASEDPVATVTNGGVFQFLRVEPGEHRLVVNGPGVAPFAERFVHRSGLHRAGVDGDLTVVASEDAAWIRGDGRESDGISHVRVVEEYAGPVFEGEPAGADRFAIAVHREGRYLVEILDGDGAFGSYRIGPSDFESDDPVPGRVETGTVSHLRTLVTFLEETDDLAAAVIEERNGETEFGAGVRGRIGSAHSDAEAALEAAIAGEAERTNALLDRIVETLVAGGEVLQDPEREYSDVAIEVLEPRLRETQELAERARRREL